MFFRYNRPAMCRLIPCIFRCFVQLICRAPNFGENPIVVLLQLYSLLHGDYTAILFKTAFESAVFDMLKLAQLATPMGSASSAHTDLAHLRTHILLALAPHLRTQI